MKIAVSYFDALGTWPNQNFKGLCDSLLDGSADITVAKYTPKELLSTTDYDAVFLLRGGDAMSADHIRHYRKNDVIISIWHDDIFKWKKVSFCHDDIYVWGVKRFACHSKALMYWFDAADILFIPYVNTFFKFRRYNRYRHKVVWLPWSAADSLVNADVPWVSRQDMVFLSGHMYKQYALRNVLGRYAATDAGKQILSTVKHYGYTPDAQSKMITGHAYYERMMAHKGSIATSAMSASDFHRAKYLEVPASGCLPFFEYTPDLHFLGFVDGINCVLIDKHNYRERLQMIHSDKAPVIASNARELVRQRHLHSHRAQTIISTIVNKVRLR